jgi:hypothetical protein
MVVERFACNESFSEFVRSCVIATLNRDNERSFKLSSDNFCGCDLFPEHDGRFALLDEPEELRPQVPFVLFSLSFARAAKWLAGA